MKQMKPPYIVQINVNPVGGVPKHRVQSALVTHVGILGDKQRNQMVHGGPTRAVSLYSYEHIQALQAEGHPIVPGSTGENLTISGLVWDQLQIGDRLIIGNQLQIELTSHALPCRSISTSLAGSDIKRLSHKVNAGWSRFYARVLVEAMVHEGDAVILQPPSIGNDTCGNMVRCTSI